MRRRERLWWVSDLTWWFAGLGTAFAALWWLLALLTPHPAAQVGAIVALILSGCCWFVVLFIGLPFDWSDRREGY